MAVWNGGPGDSFKGVIMWREISKFGKKMVQCGLTHSHFGNISVRVGNKLIITKSGTMLDEIDENMVVELDLDKPGSLDTIASIETIVHKNIYKETSALAIIHAHSPFAIVQSMISSTSLLIPTDCESKYLLHEIPIITGGVGSEELARNAAIALKNHKGAIIKEHGPIAMGKIVEEAFVTICSIEHVCKVKYFADLLLQRKG